MGMNATQLIKMANQIGAFFASQPDLAQARTEYAQHLKRQWDPQMRTALYAHLDASGGEGLSEADLAERGANRSLIHIDWMIGSGDTDIDGIKPDGSRVPVFRKGEWA